MDDLISRQAAVELAMKYCPDDDGTVQCDGDIRELLDELENLPPAQPEEAIPVSWIEAKIERFKAEDNAFCGLTANIMLVMLNEWKREQEGETE